MEIPSKWRSLKWLRMKEFSIGKKSAVDGRRKHSAEFKTNVALAALRDDKAMAQLCHQFAVHTTQINLWKSQLLQNAASAFTAGQASEPQVDIQPLHAKIGQLTLENDFLEGALTKAGLLSAKR